MPTLGTFTHCPACAFVSALAVVKCPRCGHESARPSFSIVQTSLGLALLAALIGVGALAWMLVVQASTPLVGRWHNDHYDFNFRSDKTVTADAEFDIYGRLVSRNPNSVQNWSISSDIVTFRSARNAASKQRPAKARWSFDPALHQLTLTGLDGNGTPGDTVYLRQSSGN